MIILMLNRYIQIYLFEKSQQQSELESISAALTALKQDRQSTLKKFLFKSRATNLAAITKIETALSKIDNKDKSQIASVLQQHLDELSASGDTRKLVLFILKALRQAIETDHAAAQAHQITCANQTAPAASLHASAEVDWQFKLAIKYLCRQKNLPSQVFFNASPTLTLDSPLADHVKWVFENIYSIPYPSVANPHPLIARLIHGIQHTARVAYYVPVITNLYRRYDDKEALALTEHDLKLLQIGALFHDAAREDENEDRWDHESALLLFCYLAYVLNLDKHIAKRIAEATANKDIKQNLGYFEIHINDPSQQTRCEFNLSRRLDTKTIYQKIIHDADCLDIIRARPHFHAAYLDFVALVRAHLNADNTIFVIIEEIAHLVMEARSLIATQGDSYALRKPVIKQTYETVNAYQTIAADVNADHHPILFTLSEKLLSPDVLRQQQLIDIIPYDEKQGLTAINLKRAFKEGLVCVRGIAAPSAITQKSSAATHPNKESLAALEIRKTMRELGVPTQTKKTDNKDKQGNPLRSISLIGYGSGTFTNAGFLLLKPNNADISQIAAHDISTGRGKKTRLTHLKNKTNRPSAQTITNEWALLTNELKLGGKTIQYAGWQHPSNHVEILCDLYRYDAIYYSNDPNLYNMDAYGSAETTHIFSPLLQAIFIRKQYETQYEATLQRFIATFGYDAGHEKFIARFGTTKTLPIFEYSGIHNILLLAENTLEEDDIILMWKTMCTDFMKSYQGNLIALSLEHIKVLSMYKTLTNKYAAYNAPADANYSNALRQKLDAAITAEKTQIIERNLLHKLSHKEIVAWSDECYEYLSENPAVCARLSSVIETQIKHELDNMHAYWGRSIFTFTMTTTLMASKRIVQMGSLAKKLDLKDQFTRLQHLVWIEAEKILYRASAYSPGESITCFFAFIAYLKEFDCISHFENQIKDIASAWINAQNSADEDNTLAEIIKYYPDLMKKLLPRLSTATKDKLFAHYATVVNASPNDYSTDQRQAAITLLGESTDQTHLLIALTHTTCHNQQLKLVKQLCNVANKDLQIFSQALILAIQQEQFELVFLLLENGADSSAIPPSWLQTTTATTSSIAMLLKLQPAAADYQYYAHFLRELQQKVTAALEELNPYKASDQAQIAVLNALQICLLNSAVSVVQQGKPVVLGRLAKEADLDNLEQAIAQHPSYAKASWYCGLMKPVSETAKLVQQFRNYCDHHPVRKMREFSNNLQHDNRAATVRGRHCHVL